MTTNGKEPAFPIPIVTGLPNDPIMYGCPGLTKREYFAAMIMQGLCANTKCNGSSDSDFVGYAIGRADALLKELNKNADI